MPTLTTLRRDAAYQIGIFVSGDGTRGIPYRESLATKTVAVVGDSFTFGMGVDLEDTYGKQLEQRLRSRLE